jgi:hypothetical protein
MAVRPDNHTHAATINIAAAPAHHAGARQARLARARACWTSRSGKPKLRQIFGVLIRVARGRCFDGVPDVANRIHKISGD